MRGMGSRDLPVESETTAGSALQHRGGERVPIYQTHNGFDGRLPLGFPQSDPPVANTDQKTRGGFYTPEEIAGLVLGRISILVGHPTDQLEVLEPSAGTPPGFRESDTTGDRD